MSTLEMLALIGLVLGGTATLLLLMPLRKQPMFPEVVHSSQPRFARDVFGRSTRNAPQRTISRHYRYHPKVASKRAHGGRMISRNTRKARCQTLRCRAKAQLDWFKPAFTQINRRWSKPRWDERPIIQSGL